MKTKREKLIDYATKTAKEDHGFWDKVKAFGRMAQSHMRGEYKISKKALFLVPASLIYLVVPIDFDWIPMLGWLDDLTLLTYAFSSLNKEIANFLKWELETYRNTDSGVVIVDGEIVS